MDSAAAVAEGGARVHSLTVILHLSDSLLQEMLVEELAVRSARHMGESSRSVMIYKDVGERCPLLPAWVWVCAPARMD